MNWIRHKRIGYEYDLVSGKVNQVFYQKDSVDQFVHRYAYGADNRVILFLLKAITDQD
jgi:hypothetical protein